MRTFGDHAFLQTISFDQKLLVAFLASMVALILDVDHGSMNSRYTLEDGLGHGIISSSTTHLHHDLMEIPLELTKSIELVRAVDVYAKSVLFRNYGDRLRSKRLISRKKPVNINSTSCLILSFFAATIAHLISSRVSSS